MPERINDVEETAQLIEKARERYGRDGRLGRYFLQLPDPTTLIKLISLW